jgi:ribose/xylose/arabinose/galactoside ABC-type transport system permease subunit
VTSVRWPKGPAFATRGRLDVRSLAARGGIWLALLALLLVARGVQPLFLEPANLLNIVAQSSVVGITAVGVTLVMIGRGIDVSVAGTITLSAFLAGGIMNGDNANIPLAVAAALAAGCVVGLVNGLLVARWGVEPFILTLATGTVLLGITQLYTGGTAFGDPAPAFTDFFRERHGPFPTLAIVLLLVVLAGLAIQHRTRFGRRLFLIGANPRAAFLSGVRVQRTLLVAYVLSGLAAALGGLALVGRAGVPSEFTGMGLEFQVLAAVVLGGTTFEGGRGGIGGTVAGVFVLAVAFSLVTIMGLPHAVQLLLRGLIIVAAGAIYVLARRSEH